MAPLWSKTRWSTFKYFIILIVFTYISCISWIIKCLTLYLLTWRIWWAPNNASKGQMGFNLVFKVLIIIDAWCKHADCKIFIMKLIFPNTFLVCINWGITCRLNKTDVSCIMQSTVAGEQIHDVERDRLVSWFTKHIASCSLPSDIKI